MGNQGEFPSRHLEKLEEVFTAIGDSYEACVVVKMWSDFFFIGGFCYVIAQAALKISNNKLE